MLVGYEANNALRNGKELGDYGRVLIERMSSRHMGEFRGLLFTKRVKKDYRSYFSGCSNVSTFVPTGMSRLLPSLWLRFSLNGWLRSEKVKVFHGLNAELPYGIGRDVKTLITYYGYGCHHRNSLMDLLMWKFRMRYSFRASDMIVAVSEEARRELLDMGVAASKVRVIAGSEPYEMTDAMVDQYYSLYKELLGESR